MEDRELLELAAKAAGKNVEWRGNPDEGGAQCLAEIYDGEFQCWWAPLDDDGDAFRLSVDLQISILSNIIRYEASTIALTLAGVFIKEDMLRQRPSVAARRAIVRAAAALARIPS